MEYGYQKRKGEGASGKSFGRSYTGRKLRQFGHTYPLVYTGRSKRATRTAFITGSSRHVRVSMPAGNLLRKPPKTKINMQDEFTRISRKEHRQLTRYLNRAFEEGMKTQVRDRRSRRVG